MVFALILWRPGLGLLMGKFHQFFTVKTFLSYLPKTCPYFHFWTKTLVNLNRFLPDLVCALILWRSALVLLFGQILSIFDGVICPQYIRILLLRQ